MRTIVLTLLSVALFLACAGTKTQIVVSNTAGYALFEKPLKIERAQLEGKVADQGQVPFLKEKGTEGLIPCQLDDLNGDGKWDELFTLVNLEANETKTFELVLKTAKKAPEVKVRTNIRFADKSDEPKELKQAVRLESNTSEISQQYFQFEGPGWENDMVGFRNYFDARNGIDIFGKVTDEMILDRAGLKNGPTYHEMQEWGMDILKTGNSLGAGAIALQTETGLYRIGPGCQGTFKLVTEGPLRSIIDLDFSEMLVDGMPFDIKHRVCIIAGKPWYKSVVSLSGGSSPKLVIGIVNLHSDQVYTVTGETYSAMYTHDNQAYNGEKLGMAVILPQNNIVANTAPEEGEGIIQTFYTTMETSEKPNVFFFMAGWEKQDPRWANKSDFEEGIEEQGKQIVAQLKVEVQ